MDESSLVSANGADDGLGFEMLAASLRLDQGDMHAFFNALAAKLEDALPAEATVTRERDGLFKSTTHVAQIAVDLPPFRYILAAGRGLPGATRVKIVGGIAIKTEKMGVDAWIEALAVALSVHARTSVSARAALERLVT